MTAWPVYVKQLRTSSYVFFVCLFVFWRVSIGLPMHLNIGLSLNMEPRGGAQKTQNKTKKQN